MSDWIRKDGYETCLQAAADTLNAIGTEVYLIRFRSGKRSHYHKKTTEFFHFTAGTGRVVLSGREQKLYPGATVIVQPHITHTFMNDSAEVPLEAVLVKINSLPEDTYPT